MGRGDVGFLTPDTPPVTTVCRQFTVPDDTQWLGLLMGAVLALTDESNWKQSGTLTPAQAADAFLQIFLDASPDDACSLDSDPPYWDGDDGENAENKNPVATGLPWYEDAAFTIIEAFTATLLSPPAAYAYVTTVKKFRLAYLKRDFGAIFEVQVDGDTVATIDTYSPTEQLGYLDVVIP